MEAYMADNIATDKLTLCGDYVLWDGHEVEHVDERARGSYDWKGLIDQCQHLETLQVPVRTSTVIWFKGWFHDVNPGARYLDLLRLCPGLWEHGMLEPRRMQLVEAHCPWTRLCEPSGHVYFTCNDLVVEWDGEELISSILEPGSRYETLRGQDVHTAQCGQKIHLAPCYASYGQVVAWLDSHGVTPRVASEASWLLVEQ